MRDLVVRFISGLSEVLVVVIVAAATVAGVATSGPFGGMAMGAVAFVACSLVFGLLFIALDIRQALLDIRGAELASLKAAKLLLEAAQVTQDDVA